MSRPDKAQITYMVGEGAEAVESVLRFHSVIAEEHEASTEITKFPAQTGFNISNHAIKKNRKVTISGVVSNHLIIGSEEFHEYGGNNSRIMFSTLRDLVRGAVPCEVTTNYDTYTPVIFTRFKTKLMAGKTDIMEFTITGEEVQLSTTTNGTTPTLLVFTPLTDAERQARVDELLEVGLEVPAEYAVTEASVDMNESFQVETMGTNGEMSISTYESVGYDPSTKTYKHQLHTSDTAVAASGVITYLNWFKLMQDETSELPDVDLQAGAATAGACLVDSITGLALDTASDFIDTALGELTKTIYGAAYGILGVNGDQGIGQVLLGIGIDCLVAGAIGSVDPTLNPDDFDDNTIPTADEVTQGAAEIGNGVATDTLGVAAPTTLTKISPPPADIGFFGDII